MGLFHLVVYIVLALFTFVAQAQPAGGGAEASPDSAATAPGADAPFTFGLQLGNLLPNQIAGVSEIMGLGGVRAAYKLAPLSYVEAGFITGNGHDQEWKDIHLDIRMDMPIETLMAVVYLGADANYFKGVDTGTRLIFGGHAGGGVMMHLSGSTWFRADMKFSVSPGTSLYIGFGLEWRIGGGGSGAGAG